MKTMFYAEIETSHFTFRALAPSHREAVAAIRKGLRAHCKRCGIPAGPLLEYATDDGDINVLEMKPNAAYCDYDEL